MQVAIVVLHFLNQELTQKCLESIQAIKAPKIDLEVLVVNNNPRENLKSLSRKFKEFNFLVTRKNLGFTGGNNLGIEQALKNKADWVFLVNNDTVLEPSLLIQLVRAAKKDEKVGVLGPKIYFAAGCEYHQERYKPAERGRVFWYAGGLNDWNNVLSSHRGVDEVDHGQYDQTEETDFVSGCAMLIKRQVLEKIGLLDDKYYLYLEDNDFCQRARKAGFKVIYVPKGKLWHANAGSSEVGGDLHDYFFTRNRMLFGWRFAPWRAKFALWRESVKILLTGRPWQKKGIRDFYSRKFGKGSWRG